MNFRVTKMDWSDSAREASAEARNSQTVVEGGFKSKDEIITNLKQRSLKEGGAWVYVIPPFAKPGDEVKLVKFPSPSAVPDSYHDDMNNTIVWKGQAVPFTKAARIRESNRGVSGE